MKLAFVFNVKTLEGTSFYVDDKVKEDEFLAEYKSVYQVLYGGIDVDCCRIFNSRGELENFKRRSMFREGNDK